MSAKAYYVSQGGQQLGPFSLEDIVAKLQSSELSPLDYLYDDATSDWVAFLEHKDFAQVIKEHKPKAPPKAQDAKFKEEEKKIKESVLKLEKKGEAVGEHMVTEWYVLKGENKFGPFAYTDLVKMLQQKVVYEFDFVWHPGLSTWKRIAELDSFNNKNVQTLKETLMPEISEIFFRRRHRRVAYNGTVLIHDNKEVWKGHGVEISAGGAGVIMENSMITPG
ncbi:MAG: DUF4339 domain-containing protein, partial [Bdellovibrionales bacterium]|nr:DUF4339 domain-containing protein [Bdellovibrionales bacterium]